MFSVCQNISLKSEEFIFFFTSLSLMPTVKMILRHKEKHIVFKTKHLLTKDFLNVSAFLFILCPRPCEITV